MYRSEIDPDLYNNAWNIGSSLFEENFLLSKMYSDKYIKRNQKPQFSKLVTKFVHLKRDTVFCKENNIKYLGTSDIFYRQSKPSKNDKYHSLVKKSILKKLSEVEFKHLVPSFKEFETNYNEKTFDKSVFFDFIRQNNDRNIVFSDLSKEKQSRLIIIAELVKARLFNTESLLVPFSTGKVLESPSLVHSSSGGIMYKRVVKRRRSRYFRGSNEDYRTKRDDCKTDVHGNLIIKTKGQAIDVYYDIIKKNSIAFSSQFHSQPATLEYKSQVTKYQRDNGMCLIVSELDQYIEELRFMFPFLQTIINSGSDMFVFDDYLEGNFSTVISKRLSILSPNEDMVGIYFDGFDKDIPIYLLQLAAAIIFSVYDFEYIESVDGKRWAVNPQITMQRGVYPVEYALQT
ncbi:hypothetical protein AYI68_g4047 [Smittium mucronatum]|uniref:Uncharacterized protein n=1 Tax=Smittium mucronatum TaxID=133383 RepID=A0A1R0GY61_9FUNG|nr:hypothetical protein AYI68_g4047 [Smittium mucronatum]